MSACWEFICTLRPSLLPSSFLILIHSSGVLKLEGTLEKNVVQSPAGKRQRLITGEVGVGGGWGSDPEAVLAHCGDPGPGAHTALGSQQALGRVVRGVSSALKYQFL